MVKLVQISFSLNNVTIFVPSNFGIAESLNSSIFRYFPGLWKNTVKFLSIFKVSAIT